MSKPKIAKEVFRGIRILGAISRGLERSGALSGVAIINGG
jgi:hypothetical protein